MKKEDLTMKSVTELKSTLQELQERIAQLRFDVADKKLKRTSDLKKTRLQIARTLTALKTAK